MIKYSRFQLSNGLKVLVHEDPSTPMAVMNILYDVGARDENPDKTGFAHLFEHLMFEGSKNIPHFDKALEVAGGQNNAFTSNDITNYYNTIPAGNLETLFWLESDRMKELAFSEKKLDVQKHVVIEEFKENYLNQPYGNVWHRIHELAFKIHPYRWPTIGKEISHIENVTLEEVKDFFYTYYRPNNAIMVVAGQVDEENVRKLAEKWFGDIPPADISERSLPQEPPQETPRTEELTEEVPLDALYKVYHSYARNDERYYRTDLITDILSMGHSSRLYQSLVKEQEIFSDIDAYITGNLDPGLVIVEGKLVRGKSFKEGEKAVEDELKKLCTDKVRDKELQKVKNKFETHKTYGETNILNKAMNLAYYELLGDADRVNSEIYHYLEVDREMIKDEACNIFRPENCSTIYYKAKKND